MFAYDNLVYFLQILIMKVSKWKCKVCKKLLSSKQSGLHHMNNVHSIIIDMKDHIYKVQVAEQSTSSDKENWKCNAKSKKAAYGFFKNLSNQYAVSDKYVEDFCKIVNITTLMDKSMSPGKCQR